MERRKRRSIWRWAGMALGAVLGLVAVVALFVYIRSNGIVNKAYAVPATRPLYVPSDSATFEKGRHLTTAVAMCVECHGEHLEGKKVFDDPPFGRLYAPNLTRGKGGVGVGTDYDITAFESAVRHGVRESDGTSLWVMPSLHYCYFSDDDVAALYAYVKNVPPVDMEWPKRGLGPVGRALLAQGKLPLLVAQAINQDATRPPKPAEQASAAYGQYLARVSCIGCHGPNLSGGAIVGADPTWPPAANLTKGGIAATYTEQDFFNALREGKRPGGAALSPVMPSHLLKNLTDTEIRALWSYLQTTPAERYGSSDWIATKAP